MVAGVVPGLMVLVTFAWHRIKAAEARPDWPIPVPQTPAPEPAVPSSPAPGPVQPDPERPKVVRRQYSTVLNPTQRAEALRRIEQGQSMAQVARDMDLSERARKYRLPELVREVQERRTKVSQNGGRP